MYFLNPTYLWALLGLAIPIAIHLWSKKEGKIIRIGSIQLLHESDPKQTSAVKINELWLLLLRVLVITTLVFIVAAPHLPNQGENTSITYLVEPSLLKFDEITKILDTLEPDNVKLLQPGFPEYVKNDFSAGIETTPNYWQLASEMETLYTDSIVVFTNAYQTGIKGKRPQLTKNVNWVILDLEAAADGLVAARKKGGEVELFMVTDNTPNLQIEKERISLNSDRISLTPEGDSIAFIGNSQKLPLKTEDSLKVVIFYEDALENEMRYIRASYEAISKYLDRPLFVTTTQEQNFSIKNLGAIVWLSEEAAVETTAPLLLYRPDSLANSLVIPVPSKQKYYLTKGLNAENIVSENLPETLLSILNLNKKLKERIKLKDRRVIDLEELQPVFVAGGPPKSFTESSDLSNYLWILLLVLLLVERGLARYRDQ